MNAITIPVSDATAERLDALARKLELSPTRVAEQAIEDFVAEGLMEHRQDAGEQAEYLLTRKGLELLPTILALTEWGDKWVRPGPIDYQSRSGQPVEIQIRGKTSGTKFDAADIVAVLR